MPIGRKGSFTPVPSHMSPVDCRGVLILLITFKNVLVSWRNIWMACGRNVQDLTYDSA